MYSWGDAPNQSNRATMNFLNPACDGQRGVTGPGAYKEYLPRADQKISVDLATRMKNAIKAVRGKAYTVQQDFALYPTAGTSDDYATARSWLDPTRSKVYSFTIEWGTEFQPPYTEMSKIIQDITAAMLDFCLGAVATTATTTTTAAVARRRRTTRPRTAVPA